MNITVLSKDGDKLRFLIEGVDNAFVNGLRRIILSEVPTMAIEDIFYFDNASIVPDEVLAHRVGLVPLKTDLENYVLPENCDCDADLGCPKCRAILTLDVEAEEETRTVYSGDLMSSDPMIKPVSDDIPLSKLTKGQAIRFEAYAQLGQGKEHTKWSPVSKAIYQNTIELEVDEEAAKECLAACPEAAMITDGGKLKIIDIPGFRKCENCRNLYPDNHEVVKEAMRSDEFLFSIEGHGSLQLDKIVSEAVKILVNKMDAIADKIESGDVHDEIKEFESEEEEGGRLYTVGTGEYEEEVEEEEEYMYEEEEEEP